MRSRRVASKPPARSGRKVSHQKLQLVGVMWTDAVFDDETTPKPMRMFTVGFLVEDNDLHVAIAHEVGSDGEFRGTTSVPRGMVKKVTKFGKPIPVTYEG